MINLSESQIAFIDSYSKCISLVDEETLVEFFNAGDNYMSVNSGSHIMDCWCFWQSAVAFGMDLK